MHDQTFKLSINEYSRLLFRIKNLFQLNYIESPFGIFPCRSEVAPPRKQSQIFSLPHFPPHLMLQWCKRRIMQRWINDSRFPVLFCFSHFARLELLCAAVITRLRHWNKNCNYIHVYFYWTKDWDAAYYLVLVLYRKISPKFFSGLCRKSPSQVVTYVFTTS